ncbi:hypothetical protein TSAR_016594 [Trichomalopsis sarcophagae]|uniref:non-specific serine/threonine protein kinase n=1 Tax=Trichomalopsis sarcophagae TaxID=543379 RepID=A0A232F291_9HYME|nr:hypothetical protein TSAR_016594 [Trichomalopsis sarcophagae]
MERQTIKTYSRKAPITEYKPSSALVPSFPNPVEHPHVRESRLNDKTLVVDVFEDTFDRIATGVVVKSPKKYASPHSSDTNDSDNSSDDYFKRPTRAEEETERKRVSDEFWEQENQQFEKDSAKTRQRNKKGATSKKAGVKRKKLVSKSSDEEDDFTANKQSAKVTKFKEPKQQIRKVVKRNKKDSPAKGKVPEINFPGENKNLANAEDGQLNSSVMVNDCSLGFIDENVQMSKDICNVNQKKFLHDFPTSTPRDHKQKLIVNVQNLSPITLNKEHLSVADTESISKEKHVLRESNLNDVSSQMTSLSKESNKVVESKSVQIEKNCPSNSYIHTPSKLISDRKERSETEDEDHVVEENNDENNSNMCALLPANANVDSHRNLEENDKLQVTNGKTQFFNRTPTRRNQRNDIPSFVESPLLFDDTEQSQHIKDRSVASSNISNITGESNDKSLKNTHTSKKSSSAFKNLYGELENTQREHFNESSYSPHEWSNDYDSSYGDFTNKNKTMVNRTEDPERRNLENSHEDKQIDTNNTSMDKELSKESILNASESSQQQSSGNGELQKIEDVASLVNTLDPKNESINSIITNRSIDDQRKISETDNVISQDIEHSVEAIHEIDSNSNSFELHIESNTSSTKSDSPISENQEPITNQCSKMDNADEHVGQNSMNHEHQINECSRPTMSSSTNEREESIQNNEDDERLNGQKLIIRLTKLSPDFYKSSPVFLSKTSIRKQLQMQTKNVKKSRVSKKGTKKTVSDNENSDVEKLDENRESRLFVLSGRVTKSKTNKKALKKSTRTSRKKKESYKSYAMDIVENEILHHNKTGSEGNEDKYKKLCQLFNIKELCVLLSKLPDLDMENKLSVSRRKIKSTSPIIKRKSSRKSKSIYKLGDEDKSGNESINKTVEDSTINVDAERNNSIKINKYIDGIDQKTLTVNEQSNPENRNEINASFNGEELCDILSKLSDPVKITMRRNPYKRLDRPLAAITEHLVEQPSRIDEEEEEEEENRNKEEINIETRKTDKNLVTNSSIEESDTNKLADDQTHPIFLKPGKSWARSLSIINHFHTGQNLDQLAVGRGKSWRHSVQTILNMQSEANAQAVARNCSEDKDEHSQSFNMPLVPPRESNRVSTIVTSPSRFSRFSIRIIPDGKRSTLTDDFTHSRGSSNISDRTRKTSLSRKTSLKIRRETLIETEEDLIRSAKDIILKRCKQKSYLQFSDCFPDSYIENCRKIGEGVYGEVFLYQNKTEKSVIKIIPIEGDELVNCERQKKFHEILSEIIISEELHKLRFGSDFNTNGFVGVNRIMCVIGKYPEKLIDLWNAYDQEKNSENDCPTMFYDDQLYIILELAHGGQDLEAYVFQNASESYSIFLQTAFTLAVAEQALEFEHRDLHWGNILISKSDDNESTYKLGSEEISLPTKGVKVSVIDFTLSRMSYQGCKIFNDLAADPTLFTAQGEYQFDIYRMMRDNVNNDWQQFNPYTNVLWLDYTLDKMITAARYKRKTSKIHKSAIEEMKMLRKEVLNYKSAFEFVSKCEIITNATKT